jgi:hypothetical protein
VGTESIFAVNDYLSPMIRRCVVLTAIAMQVSSAPADTLLHGAVYVDSKDTLAEVLSRAATEDRDGIEDLIKAGHLSRPTLADREVVVTVVEESLVEFSFIDNPASYWTLAKFIEGLTKPLAPPLPYNAAPLNAEPSPTPILTVPTPTPTLTQRHERHRRGEQNADNDDLPPLDTEGGKKAWHKVNGEWSGTIRGISLCGFPSFGP